MVPCRQHTGRQDHVATTWQRRAVGDDRDPIGFWCPDLSTRGVPTGAQTCRPVECQLVLSARGMRTGALT